MKTFMGSGQLTRPGLIIAAHLSTLLLLTGPVWWLFFMFSHITVSPSAEDIASAGQFWITTVLWGILIFWLLPGNGWQRSVRIVGLAVAEPLIWIIGALLLRKHEWLGVIPAGPLVMFLFARSARQPWLWRCAVMLAPVLINLSVYFWGW